MRRSWFALMLLALSLGVVACGERVQTASSPKKADAKAWQGNDENPAYSASGWNAGDRASWENQIRIRNQAQNEYNKAR